MKKVLVFLLFVWGSIQISYSQIDSVNSVDVDEIEVILKSVSLSERGDTATIEFFLQSYLRDPRELKINTFATGIVSPQGKTMFYDSMNLGNVRVKLTDRQNYMHYLLTRQDPVLFVVKTPGWKSSWGKPKGFRFTVEDHLEEGKFLQVDIPL